MHVRVCVCVACLPSPHISNLFSEPVYLSPLDLQNRGVRVKITCRKTSKKKNIWPSL